MKKNKSHSYTGFEIAVVGVSGKFPEANNVEEFWNNIANGKNSVLEFSDEELIEEGENKYNIENENYVKFGSFLENKKYFDAAFFDYNPSEAELMNPQIRIFHECCWHALEDSGYANAQLSNQKVGLFAGCSSGVNWAVQAFIKNGQKRLMDEFNVQLLSSVSHLSTMVAYKLNLRGPVMFMQTACSSSLTAIHEASNSLLLGECKMALAGGVTINNFSKKGYLYQEGMIHSRDGHCRPFDHRASGTVFGEGAGVVVLKRLKDALNDNDHIYAVIKGSGLNNDGNNKIGYTAPSVSGQVEVITKAIKNSRISPSSISYIEAHGTGTVLGDPIEVSALKSAYGSSEFDVASCALGSVKANIGHIDTAAGIAGFLKVVMALKHRQIPPSINFESLNPKIDLSNSPFYINTALKDWDMGAVPLRAGISSLGIGGTNVHMILEEAPVRELSSESRQYNLLTVSGKSHGSLLGNLENLASHISGLEAVSLSDIGYTLNSCRESFDYRYSIVGKDKGSLVSELESILSTGIQKEKLGKARPGLIFMFPGQGAQYSSMCLELYNQEPLFREALDRCFGYVKTHYGKDLHAVIYGSESDKLISTEYTQASIFSIEYSLARLLMSWGLVPDGMIGHSLGEYVAACLSGVFRLEDALDLVVKRGELMGSMAEGSMLSVLLSSEAIGSYLSNYPGLSIATINSPGTCVVSGETSSIVSLESDLSASGVKSKILSTSHAFHSGMMDGILEPFSSLFKDIEFGAVGIPFISNVTGDYVGEEVKTASYWTGHIRECVRFSDGLDRLMEKDSLCFVEVGPGRSLGSFVGSSASRGSDHKIVSLLKHKGESQYHVLEGLGKLWRYGLSIDWASYYGTELRHKVSLPGYSFDKVSYPVDVNAYDLINSMVSDPSLQREEDLSRWFYRPTWRLSGVVSGKESASLSTIVFMDDSGVGSGLSNSFKASGVEVIEVYADRGFSDEGKGVYRINPLSQGDYKLLYESLKRLGLSPSRIVHCWSIGNWSGLVESIEDHKQLYFYSLLEVLRVSESVGIDLDQVCVLSTDVHGVLSGRKEERGVYKSLLLGFLKVLGQEYPSISTGHINIDLEDLTDSGFIIDLYEDIIGLSTGSVVTYDHGKRWLQVYERLEVSGSGGSVLKDGGVYLLTGGLGALGYRISEYLLSHYNAKLLLIGRTDLSDIEAVASTDIESKASRLASLKAKSGDGAVMYSSCDLSDVSSLEAVLSSGESALGGLDGVFHLSGVLSGSSFNSINSLQDSDYELQYGSKVEGLGVLHKVLEGRSLDFCMLSSSLSSVLGGLGFGAYASGNSYMDSYVNYHASQGEASGWLSVNLDGLDFNDASSTEIRSTDIPELLELLMTFVSEPQVVVSTRDLQHRLSSWIEKSALIEDEDDEGVIEGLSLSEDELSGLTEVEAQLYGIWVHFFGRNDFSIVDDFFEIGGDSLKALTLSARINRDLGVNLSLTDFFGHPTIQGLSSLISSSLGRGEVVQGLGSLSIAPAEIQAYYALSAAQRRLYFLYELDKDSLAYNQYQTLELKGALDKAKLERSFKGLLERHEILRTQFVLVDDQVYQQVLEEVPFEIAYYEAPEGDYDDLLKDFIRPFDLGAAPLFRVGVIKISSEQHALVVDMHHIITDGVSQGIMIRDFMALYEGETLEGLRLQYKDYSEWQQSEVYQESLEVEREYWLEAYSKELSLLELPIDYSRPEIKSYKGDKVSFNLDKDITASLRSLGDKEGATLFMSLLSIFNVLLSKLSGQEDIVVGTGIAGRSHADLEDIVGMFVNTLAIRNSVQGDLSFRDFLAQVKEKTLEGLEYQHYPYEELVGHLDLPRDTSRNPLFDVMFVLQNFDKENLGFSDLEVSSKQVEHHVSKFDLQLTGIELEEGIRLDLEYSLDLFKRATIERFTTYFERIVSQVVLNPDIALGDIVLLDKEEAQVLLEQFNATEVAYPQDKTVIDLFESQVDLTPDAIAVFDGTTGISYKDLNNRVNQQAHFLVSQGIKPGAVVGVLMERSIDFVTGVLSVLKAGGLYLPLPVSYPKERLIYMLENSGASLVISKTSLLSEDIEIPCNWYNYDASIETINSFSETNLGLRVWDDIYIIYTSGSTGLPKGVRGTHKGLLNRLYWGWERYPIGKSEVHCLKTNIGFVDHVVELFSPLLSGVALRLYTTHEVMDVSGFYSSLLEDKITRLTVVPTYLQSLIEVKKELGLETPDCLRYVFTSGESLPGMLAKDFYEAFDLSELVNIYGSSEVGADATYYDLDKKSLAVLGDTDSYRVLIGHPISNTSIYILNETHHLQPIGVIGEIYVQGAGISSGYIHNPSLNEEHFIKNPFNEEGLMYRTGDLGRWTEDGSIEFLGRLDSQVKIRGIRIELGEIEFEIKSQETIKEAVVLANNKEGVHKELIAYYVSEETIEGDVLRNYLSTRLPDHMLPSYFVQLEALPLLPNGKIDNKSLLNHKIEKRNLVLASNDLEQELTQIWSELLDTPIELIGVNISFFEIGGNSLLASKLANKLSEYFNIKFELNEIFVRRNIKNQAEYIELNNWLLNEELSEGKITEIDI